MDALVLLMSLILIAEGACSTSHANSAMDYWQTLLPRSPMPPAILDLLNHHAGFNNVKSIKDSKNVYTASQQAGDDFKEIFVSYGSQGNKKDLKEISVSYGAEGREDVKEISVSSGPETNKDIKRSLGYKHDKKVMAESSKKILAESSQREENLKEISVSHGSKFEEGLKEISVSYGLEGKEDSRKVSMKDLRKILVSRPRNEENLKEISVLYGSKLDEDLKEISVAYGSKLEEDLKEISVSYGLEGKQDSKKVSMEDLQKILEAKLQNEENLKEISVSYGSKLDEDLKEISVSYGLDGLRDLKRVSVIDLKNILAARRRHEENLNEISVSYGPKLDDNLKEISVSYGSEDEKDLKEISVSYGAEGREDVKEISVSYGQEDKDGLKKISASEGDKAGEEHFHADAGAHAHKHRSRRIADVFFFHDMLRPGTMMTPTIPPTSSLPALLPRHVANSIPFSAKRFPDIVAMFAPASFAIAGEMRWTLDTCEHPRPLPGQKAGCATSIESLTELTASLLGTHDVLAFSSDMPLEAAGTSALRARHNVTAARRVSMSLEVVTCQDLTYSYAVFYCHTSNSTAAYMVTLESEDGAAPAMEALAVCHLDTSQWNPENPFFKLHSVSPGEVAVCHFLSKLSIIWVRSGELGDLRAAE
ncbi:hypothetical protein ACQ4PT_016137 [Festuca glaucescens]